MATGIGRERRKYPRAWTALGLKLGHEKEEIETDTKNISACGLLCQIDRWLPLMTKLRITIVLPSKKIICIGIVVRIEQVEGLYNVAIFFSDIKPKDRAKISDYVQSQITKNISPAYSGN